MIAWMGRVLLHPSLSVFQSARANANLGHALTTTLMLGIVTGFIGGIINFISVGDSLVEVITLTIITPLRLVFALIVTNALWLALLRPFGARGDFATQTFLSGLAMMPMIALASLLAAIPTIGAVLAIGALGYGSGVNVFALRAAHAELLARPSNLVLWAVSLSGGVLGWLAMSGIPQ
jgi:hypothetical protein